MKSKSLRTALIFAILLILMASFFGCTQKADTTQYLTVHFFQFDETNEKWGDCTLFTLADGTTMLVDCGAKSVGEYLVSDLKATGIDTIDVFLISHFHSDHIGCFQAIIDSFDVKQVYSPGFVPAECNWIEKEINRRQIPYEYLTAGDSFAIGGAQVEVLWPTADLVAENPTAAWTDTNCVINTNIRSMVFRLDFKGNSVLMTGDIYKEAQRDILNYYAEDLSVLDVDVLKIPHHGYQNAVNYDFIEVTTPQYAIMQGNFVMNKVSYKRYTEAGCTTYAGWMNGDVEIVLSGEQVTATAEKPEIKDYYT